MPFNLLLILCELIAIRLLVSFQQNEDLIRPFRHGQTRHPIGTRSQCRLQFCSIHRFTFLFIFSCSFSVIWRCPFALHLQKQQMNWTRKGLFSERQRKKKQSKKNKWNWRKEENPIFCWSFLCSMGLIHFWETKCVETFFSLDVFLYWYVQIDKADDMKRLCKQ